MRHSSSRELEQALTCLRRPIKDLDFYLRKTKTPDYNTLSELVRSSYLSILALLILSFCTA